MIWYEDDELQIIFDDTPYVSIRYALPSMSDIEIKSIKKYPFINKRDFGVEIRYKNEIFNFIIPKGYCFDGASIPWLFRRIIGAPTDNSFLIAALIHDVICENHKYVKNNRKLSTKIFDALLTTSRVGRFKRFLMTSGVNMFQKLFCDWGLEWTSSK